MIPRAHCRRHQELVHRQSHPADPPPAIFTGSRPHRLPKGEGVAGWPLSDPGEPQEDLGRGSQDHITAEKCYVSIFLRIYVLKEFECMVRVDTVKYSITIVST